MQDPRELIFDAWTPLSFKRHFGSRRTLGEGAGFKPPDWAGDEHLRRLQAYAILRSYIDNSAREFFNGKREDIEDRREYGDAALLVDTVLAALLGENQQIVTEGAEELVLEDSTTQDQGDVEGAPKRILDPEDEKRRRDAEAAIALQDFLRQWAQDERLGLKMLETERLAVGLGDGIYAVGWSSEKKRPRLRVYSPEFYYPVLTDGNEDDFPEKVHVAWQIPDEDNPSRVKVRRLTWQLGPIVPAAEEGTVGQLLGRGPQLQKGDRLEADGKITRLYPWNEEPSSVTCYFSDATWTIEKGVRSVNDFTEATAEYETDGDGEIQNRDLFVDFLPVVHLPNNVALIDHYGKSVLTYVLQVLDDLSSADTDLSAAAATTGHPVLALQGATVQRDSHGRSKMSYRPGEILETGDGKMDVLDTSKSLSALMDYIQFLLKRLSTNSRVSEQLMGRVNSADVNSGVQLALGFGPTESLVRNMRLVRDEKYPLLLKFAHRMFQMAQQMGEVSDVPPEWIHTNVIMGSFLPQDVAAAVDHVTALYSKKAISIETVIAMLMEVGLPITSVLEEVRRIQQRDFSAAAELLDATDDQALVHQFLGYEPPEEPEPPEVELDPSQVPIPPNGQTPPAAGNGAQPPVPEVVPPVA